MYKSTACLIFCLLFTLACQTEKGPAPVTWVDTQDWEGWAEVDSVRCGFLEVPEDHFQDDSPRIKVAFAIFEARNSNPEVPPVIMLTGGPGGRSLNWPGRWENHSLRADRDIIVIEQRGIGLSSPLVRSGEAFMDILAADLNSTEEKVATRNLMKRISKEIKESGQDPAKYNTIQNAHDLGLLMQALDYPKYCLSGSSYGTKYGMYTMKYFPEYIHASILNAPATLSGNALENRIPDYLRSLNLLFAECAKDPDCQGQHPDLKTEMIDAVNTLEDNPITIDLADRRYTINPQDAMYFLRYQLYNAQGFKLAPQFIAAIKNRDTLTLKEISAGPSQMLRVGNMSAFISFQAYEEFSTTTAEQTAKAIAAAPELSAGFAWFQSIIPEMAYWHDSRISPEEHHLEGISIPTLIIVNEFDPVTPPENTKLFEAALENATVIRLQRFGHGAGGDCIRQMEKDFLRDPNAKLDRSCL